MSLGTFAKSVLFHLLFASQQLRGTPSVPSLAPRRIRRRRRALQKLVFMNSLKRTKNHVVSSASSLALSNTHNTTTTLHEFSETCSIITSLCNLCSSCLLLLPPLLTAIIPVICILDLICVVVVWVCDWRQCNTKSPDATWGKKILLYYPWWCLCEILSWFPLCDSLSIPLWQCD